MLLLVSVSLLSGVELLWRALEVEVGPAAGTDSGHGGNPAAAVPSSRFWPPFQRWQVAAPGRG